MISKLRTLCITLLLCLASLVYAHGSLDVANLVEQVSPAVVNINVTPKVLEDTNTPKGNKPHEGDSLPEFWRKFFEQPRRLRPSIGSGFILSADGYIITNAHVVDNASRVTVKLSDRQELQADVIGSDKRSDIALLKVKAKNLPAVKIGSSKQLRVGQGVVAIGSPFGFEHSVTFGIVSALRRSLPSDNYVPFIQTDAAVNPGNSGGPLFDLEGNVVGVNSQIYTDGAGFIGLSFAVPIELAMDVIEQLKEDGRVTRGWLGVYIQEVTQDLAKSFGLERPQGALISGVLPDSPASHAEIEVGDIVLQVNDKDLSEVVQLPHIIGSMQPGEKAVLGILRKGDKIKLKVTIAELPDDIDKQDSKDDKEKEEDTSKVLTSLGMTVRGLEENEMKEKDIEQYAILIQDVEMGGIAYQTGLRQGDLILLLNGEIFNSFDEFVDLVDELPAEQMAALFVQRKEMTRFFALRIP